MYLPFVATLALCRGDFTHFLLSFFLKGGKGNNMDQKKIGLFLKELRKEKELTQSQLAEQLNVSDRTVSRWETGTNLPDLSVLVELADFYDVDIREIIDGERKSENMNVEMKDTLMKAAQYATEDKHMQMKKLTGYILSAFGCFLILSGFTVFPSESGWAAKFAILGAIIVTVGIFQLLKKRKLLKSIIIFIAILFGMIWLDFASVCYIRQAPRFVYSVEYSDETVIYHAPFYSVYKYGRDTLGEYYQVYIGFDNL